MYDTSRRIVRLVEGRAFEFYGIINDKDEFGPNATFAYDPRVKNGYIKRRPDLDMPLMPAYFEVKPVTS